MRQEKKTGAILVWETQKRRECRIIILMQDAPVAPICISHAATTFNLQFRAHLSACIIIVIIVIKKNERHARSTHTRHAKLPFNLPRLATDSANLFLFQYRPRLTTSNYAMWYSGKCNKFTFNIQCVIG